MRYLLVASTLGGEAIRPEGATWKYGSGTTGTTCSGSKDRGNED
jgi:hypothetical protein